MNIKFFLLLLLFFGITPNLGFFTLPAFLIITFVVLVYLTMLFLPENKYPSIFKNSKKLDPSYFFILLFYSAIYYGGLYQNKESIITGNFILLGLIFFVFIYQNLLKKNNFILPVIILVYIFLSFWTIYFSPKPVVDTITVLKEAPLKFIQGINPYDTNYTKVYPNINPNYYNYLPFSFIYMLPFVLLLGDPRFGIIAANLLTAFIFYNLFSKHNNKQMLNMIIFTFLFFPRSFYMLEHSFMDPVIFAFFMLAIFLFLKKKIKSSVISLAFFFSFRQTQILLLPFFFIKAHFNKYFSWQNLILFITPFILPLIFIFIDAKAFLNNTIFNLNPKTITSPIFMSLTLPTFLTDFITYNNSKSYLIGYFLLSIFYIFTLVKKIPLMTKIIIGLILYNYTLYHAFFNSYYLIAQFLLLDIAFSHFKLESKEIFNS